MKRIAHRERYGGQRAEVAPNNNNQQITHIRFRQ